MMRQLLAAFGLLALTLSPGGRADTLDLIKVPLPDLHNELATAATLGDDESGPLQGLASWYGPGLQGHTTSSGERFHPKMLTAAHRSLPLGSLVEVSLPGTDKHVIVRINDRGPQNLHRIIDLSYGAAAALGITHRGVARVTLRPIQASELGPEVASLDGHSCSGQPQLQTP